MADGRALTMTKAAKGLSTLSTIFVALIRLYQWLFSPVLRVVLGRTCRFEPSCSRYAVACIEEHGALRGGLLSILRLCKCHPFHPGGFDPPPLSTRRAV
jgi:uncharacterized protein